jgi:hypothetical protein
MVHLVAKKALTYERRQLKAGDPFVARPHHARWLVATKLAVPQEAAPTPPRPPARPAPSPRPTPPPEVPVVEPAPTPPDPDPSDYEPPAGPLTERVRRVVGQRPTSPRKR